MKKIILRGKIWKQITKEEFFKEWRVATFVDYHGEITYFKEIKKEEKCLKKRR